MPIVLSLSLLWVLAGLCVLTDRLRCKLVGRMLFLVGFPLAALPLLMTEPSRWSQVVGMSVQGLPWVVNVTLLLGWGIGLGEQIGLHRGRRYAAIAVASSGVVLASLADDIFLIALGVELAALTGGVWMTTAEQRPRPFVRRTWGLAQALSGVLILLGLAMLCGLTGESTLSGMMNSDRVRLLLPSPGTTRLAIIAWVPLLAGLAMRLAAVPFHLGWADLLHDADISTVRAVLLFPRVAAGLVLLRLIPGSLPRMEPLAETLLLLSGCLSTLWAMVQLRGESVASRRLLAITLGQSGLFLLALAVGAWEIEFPEGGIDVTGRLPDSQTLAILVLMTDLVALSLIVSGLQLAGVPPRLPHGDETLAGLVRRSKRATLALTIGLLMAMGCPPLPAFWTRSAVLLDLLAVRMQSLTLPVPVSSPIFVLAAIAIIGQLLLVASAALKWLMAAFVEVPEPEPHEIDARSELDLPTRRLLASEAPLPAERRTLWFAMLLVIGLGILGLLPNLLFQAK